MDFSKKEQQILEFWEKNKIFEKSLEARKKGPKFIFYDGPPFATGLPHYGHILASTIKDVVPRYWTMKGYQVERRWGWDCHGLPIEEIAERALKISGKKQIEKLGIEKFNQFCKSKVLTYAKEWGKTIKRIGRWVEFENAYKTMDTSYMESVWWAFKKIWDKGLIYEGKKVLLFCPRCETPISNFEVAMDQSYRDITEKAPVVKFKITNMHKFTTNNTNIIREIGGKFVDIGDTYILAWTTTPWTLIGNLALAVNPEVDYVMIRIRNHESGPKDSGLFRRIMNQEEFLILAKERLSIIDQEYEIIEEFKGKNLVGLEYEKLYPEIESSKKGWCIVDGGDEVTMEDGTGVVHLALYGEFDYQMVKKYDLSDNQHIGLDGKLKQGPKEWLGLYFKDLDEKVLNDLKKRGLLYSAENYTHSYPFCWRCGTLLFYTAIRAWFINIQKIKNRLLELNEKINWYPEFLKEGRFKKGIETAPDWNVSRNRYWATPIPIWSCEKCGGKKCLGSIEELKKLQVISYKLQDLHRPYIDEIILECAKCGSQMKRIPEVLDCWFESASMPFAQKHYPFENKEWFEKNFPAQFVVEYIAQTRAWFYVTHVVSTVLFDKPAVENIVTTGTIMAEDGTKMSKSKGNFPDPWLLFEKYGVDALRYYLMSSPVMSAETINFSEKQVDEVYKKLILPLWNVFSFWKLYNQNSNLKTQISKPQLKSQTLQATSYKLQALDRWILARLNQLIKEVTENLEKYELTRASRPIEDFVQDLSTWYLRRSRDRIKEAHESFSNKTRISTRIKTRIVTPQEVLGYALLELSKIMAPFTPFIAEEIYQQLKISDSTFSTIVENALSANNIGHQMSAESVHLCDWPEVDEKMIDEKLLYQMQQVREICELGHKARAEAGVKVRQPLQELRITNYELKGVQPEAQRRAASKDQELLDLIKDELNVKNIVMNFRSDPLLSLWVALQSSNSKGVQPEAQRRAALDSPSALAVGWQIAENSKFKIALNTKITPALKQEGIARELIRQINTMRKEAKLTIKDKITLYWQTDSKELKRVFEKFKKQIEKEIIGQMSNVKCQKSKVDFKKELIVEGEKVWISFYALHEPVKPLPWAG